MMTARDCTMFGLYLVAIAMGVVMATDGRNYGFGIFQVCFVAFFFALRLYMVFVVRPRRAKSVSTNI